jgi:hypothetical protein
VSPLNILQLNTFINGLFYFKPISFHPKHPNLKKACKDASGQVLVEPLLFDLYEPFDTPFVKLLYEGVL